MCARCQGPQVQPLYVHQLYPRVSPLGSAYLSDDPISWACLECCWGQVQHKAVQGKVSYSNLILYFLFVFLVRMLLCTLRHAQTQFENNTCTHAILVDLIWFADIVKLFSHKIRPIYSTKNPLDLSAVIWYLLGLSRSI